MNAAPPSLDLGGRFSASELVPYIASQVLGAVAGAGILYLIASGAAGFHLLTLFRCILGVEAVDAFACLRTTNPRNKALTIHLYALNLLAGTCSGLR